MMNPETRIFKFLAPFFVLCAVVVIIACLAAVASLHWHGPFRDGWEFFWLYQSLFETGVDQKARSALLEPYAGAHRLALTHLILAADWQWFTGHNHLPIVISLLCLSGLLSGSWLLFKQHSKLEKHETGFLLAVLAMILFNQSAVFSINYVFMVQLYLAVFLTWLACWCFFQGRQGKLFWLLLLLPCFFSNFFSVAAVFIPGFYFLFKRQWLYAGLAFIAAIVAIYLYLPHGDGGAAAQKQTSVSEALKLLGLLLFNYTHFVLRYLSAPLSLQAPVFAMLISGVAIISVLYLFFNRVFSDKDFCKAFDIYLVLCLITLFIAYATAFGRFNPMSAMAERYQPAVIFFWFCFLSLIFVAVKKPAIKIIFSVFALIVFFPMQQKVIDENIFLAEKIELANHAANMGLTHKDVVRPVLSFPINRMGINPVKDFNSRIAAEKKAYFEIIENNAHKDLSCPLKTETPRKLVLSKIFKNSDFQWYEAKLKEKQIAGNFSMLIEQGVYPARLVRQSLWNNKSDKVFFIAPLSFDPGTSSLAYFSGPGESCVIEYD